MRSFDGNCGFLAFSPHILGELCTLPRRELTACAAVLQRTLTGSAAPGSEAADLIPGAWAVCCGEPETWLRTFERPAVEESGLLHDFLFCEVAGESAAYDPAAMLQLGKEGVWRDFMEDLFLSRLCNSPIVRVFSIRGAAPILNLHKWCRQFAAGLSAEVRPHFAHWPAVAARLALSLSIMHGKGGDGTVPDVLVEEACDFTQRYAPIQAEILAKFFSPNSKAVTTERQIQRMLAKLRARGPLSLRGLVRTYDRQDYARIEEWLHLALARGLAEQRGPLFFAASVSVSAGNAPHVLNFTEAVRP